MSGLAWVEMYSYSTRQILSTRGTTALAPNLSIKPVSISSLFEGFKAFLTRRHAA
jgi:hypothetical protein